MLPETGEVIDQNQKEGRLGELHGVALAEVLMIVGFLMIYIVEELAHYALDKMRHRPMKREADCCESKPEPHEPHEDIATDIFTTINKGSKGSFQVRFDSFSKVV